MIPIYKREMQDGVSALVATNTSIAYDCSIIPFEPANQDYIKKTFAEIRQQYGSVIASEKDSDLFFHKSILVTTNWNGNDDYFPPAEVWAARFTPSHKPTNIGHDEHMIVGHMTDSWPITDDGTIISDDTPIDELPDTFHLVNAAVIYKQWQDETLIERTNKLIEQINAGQKFVSMECMFSGFDYVLRSQANQEQFHVVPRNNESAFLTKYLRAYGGLGIYENYQVGRALRRIVFSAKGYVDTPANKKSIIFTESDAIKVIKASEINPLINNSGVLHTNSQSCTAIIKENLIMTAENTKAFEDQISDLKVNLKSLTDANKALEDRLAQAAVEQHENLIKELNNKIEAGTQTINTLNSTIAQLTTEKTDLSAALETEQVSKVTLLNEMNVIKAAATKAQRIAVLVNGGVSKDSAVATVEKFQALDDEVFAAIADVLIKAQTARADDPAPEPAEPEPETVLDDVEVVVEPTLSTSSDTSDTKVNMARAALADWLEVKFGQKTE